MEASAADTFPRRRQRGRASLGAAHPPTGNQTRTHVVRTRSHRTMAIGTEAVQLFAVVPLDGSAAFRITGADVVQLRDLVAITRLVPYAAVNATSEAIGDYRRIVESTFQEHPLLPAPFGTVFRSKDSLLHWMEVHYVTLVDAMGFVHDRVMARVRLQTVPLRPEQLTDTIEMRAADFETTVFDSIRFLKRNAVACVTFAPQDAVPSGRTVEASFLLERDRWSSFADAVGEEQRRLPELAIEQSGPWPPYDFVRLQFGA